MKVLIIYATNSGGTYVASEAIREIFENRGNTVTLVRASEANPADMAKCDLVVFGSCSWELFVDDRRLDGQLQQHFVDFQQRVNGSTFPGIQFAVFGLGDSSYSHFCSAVKHLEALVAELKGTLVGEPLCIDGFFFDQEANITKLRTWAKDVFRVSRKG